MIKNLISLAFILYASKSINAHNDLKGHNEYTGIVLGDMNILISAPHGGLLKPDNIEDRTATNYGDYNTLKFAHELRKKIENKFQAAGLTKHSPFLVYNELHRYFANLIIFFSNLKFMLFIVNISLALKWTLIETFPYLARMK